MWTQLTYKVVTLYVIAPDINRYKKKNKKKHGLIYVSLTVLLATQHSSQHDDTGHLTITYTGKSKSIC
jgi:hypothetical protein